jgi:hypothetical protein
MEPDMKLATDLLVAKMAELEDNMNHPRNRIARWLHQLAGKIEKRPKASGPFTTHSQES